MGPPPFPRGPAQLSSHTNAEGKKLGNQGQLRGMKGKVAWEETFLSGCKILPTHKSGSFCGLGACPPSSSSSLLSSPIGSLFPGLLATCTATLTQIPGEKHFPTGSQTAPLCPIGIPSHSLSSSWSPSLATRYVLASPALTNYNKTGK